MRLIKTIMPALIIVLMIALCWWGIVLLSDAPTDEPILRTDPIFGVTLNGDAPQIVKRYEEGDDIRPNLHTVYYYPELDQYEVVVIMGRDR